MKAAKSRTLYLLSATLLVCSLVSCGVSLMPNALQPNLPLNGSVSKTIGLALLLLSLVCTLAAVLTTMFEQVERRSEDRMRQELREDLARLGRNKRPK